MKIKYMAMVLAVLLLGCISETFAAAAPLEQGLTVKDGKFVRGDGTIIVPRGFAIVGGLQLLDRQEAFAANWGVTPAAWLAQLAAHGVNLLYLQDRLRVTEQNGESIQRNLGWLLAQCAEQGIYVAVPVDGTGDTARRTLDFCLAKFPKSPSLALWEFGGTPAEVSALSAYCREVDPQKRPVGTFVEVGKWDAQRKELLTIKSLDWLRAGAIGNWVLQFPGDPLWRQNPKALLPVALSGGPPRLRLPVPPGPTGLREYPAEETGHPASFAWLLWRDAAGFSSTLLGLDLFDNDPTLPKQFPIVLRIMASFAKGMEATIEADHWGLQAVDVPPNGNASSFAMASDGRHLVMNGLGFWDATRIGNREAFALSGLRPGAYQVLWYDAMTGTAV